MVLRSSTILGSGNINATSGPKAQICIDVGAQLVLIRAEGPAAEGRSAEGRPEDSGRAEAPKGAKHLSGRRSLLRGEAPIGPKARLAHFRGGEAASKVRWGEQGGSVAPPLRTPLSALGLEASPERGSLEPKCAEQIRSGSAGSNLRRPGFAGPN